MNFLLVSVLTSACITRVVTESVDEAVTLTEPLSADGLNPDQCGVVKNVRRITGGKEAHLGQFPWMARLGYEKQSVLKFNCGAALLNQYYVLTAAHCIYGWEDKLRLVRLGENYADTEEDCEGNVCAPPVQDINIGQIFQHPEYNHTSAKNDIAIIRLSKPAEYNEGVKPICLPQKNLEKKTFVSQSVEVAGWGIMDSSKEITSQNLLYVSLPIRDLCACEKAMPTMHLDGSQFCAGLETGEDSCTGDSGGPLMKIEYVGGYKRYHVLGLVSFGKTYCGEAPSVYTNVIYHLGWIQYIIHGTEMNEPPPNSVGDIVSSRDNWYTPKKP